MIRLLSGPVSVPLPKPLSDPQPPQDQTNTYDTQPEQILHFAQDDSATGLILKDRGTGLVLKDRGMRLVLKDRGMRLVLKDRGTGLVLKDNATRQVNKALHEESKGYVNQIPRPCRVCTLLSSFC